MVLHWCQADSDHRQRENTGVFEAAYQALLNAANGVRKTLEQFRVVYCCTVFNFFSWISSGTISCSG